MLFGCNLVFLATSSLQQNTCQCNFFKMGSSQIVSFFNIGEASPRTKLLIIVGRSLTRDKETKEHMNILGILGQSSVSSKMPLFSPKLNLDFGCQSFDYKLIN